MSKAAPVHLSRRESQIMEIVYRRGRATVAEVLDEIPDPPSYSSVRALLRILVRKGHLRFNKDGPRYVFVPVLRLETASRSALRRCIETFFSGSTERAVAAILDLSERQLTREELDRLSCMIAEARKAGK